MAVVVVVVAVVISVSPSPFHHQPKLTPFEGTGKCVCVRERRWPIDKVRGNIGSEISRSSSGGDTTHTHRHLLFTAHFRALSIEQQQRTTLPLHVCLQVFSYTQWGIYRGPITRGDNKNIHRIESIANGPQRRPQQLQQQKLA